MDLFDIAVAKALAGGSGGGGGGGLDFEVGEWTPTANQIKREFVPFAKTHSELPTIVIATFTQTSADYWGNNNVTKWQYTDYYKLHQAGYNTERSAADGFGYSLIEAITWYNSASATTLYKMMTSHNSSESVDTDKTYPRYFVTESGFYATADFKSSSAYFPKHTSGIWKWIAIWT